jgi:flagellar export protein FliJ
MSRALHVLLRLQREGVETHQIALARVAEERTKLARAQQDQDIEIAGEKLIAENDPPALSPYGAYAKRNVQEAQARAQHDATLEREEASLRADLTAAFAELKKFETLLEQQTLRERVAANAAEMAALDESAITQSVRRLRNRD